MLLYVFLLVYVGPYGFLVGFYRFIVRFAKMATLNLYPTKVRCTLSYSVRGGLVDNREYTLSNCYELYRDYAFNQILSRTLV